MTDEQVKLARGAAKLARDHLAGAKLYEGLKIGESLLVGRAAAMKAAKTNKPSGKLYAEALREWKTAFKFPTGKDAEALYDAAIVCAANRTFADEIIAMLDAKRRADMGVFGLAVRVRAKLRELSGERKQLPARVTQQAQFADIKGRMADIEEQLTAARSEDPLRYWRKSPREVARILVRTSRSEAQALADAIAQALTENKRDDD
jgi:hypothetical protein